MSKRLQGGLLLLLVACLVAPSALAGEPKPGLRTARASHVGTGIGPAPAPLPVASPAAPGDDDMPNRTGTGGRKVPTHRETTAAEDEDWSVTLMRALRARWIVFVDRQR